MARSGFYDSPRSGVNFIRLRVTQRVTKDCPHTFSKSLSRGVPVGDQVDGKFRIFTPLSFYAQIQYDI